MTVATGDSVTFEYTGRLADGTVFDTTRERVAEEAGIAERQPDRNYEAFTAEIGTGEIIDGLEDALLGLEESDETTVEVPPEQAYGERTDDRIETYEADQFERTLDVASVEEGMRVQIGDGEVGRVVHAGSETVRLDLNHELAGETLEFEIEVLDVS